MMGTLEVSFIITFMLNYVVYVITVARPAM